MDEDDIKLFVLDFVDEIITLDVNPSTTIHQLFPRLRNSSTDDVSDYLLLFRGRNLLDSSTSTLHQCGITDQDQLILSRRGLFGVRVRHLPQMSLKLLIQVETLDKVRDLKKKIHQLSGVPAEKQNLFYGYSLMDDDDSPLATYGIFNPWDGLDACVDFDRVRYVIDLQTDGCKTCLPLHVASLINHHVSAVTDDVSSSDCTIVIEVPINVGTSFLSIAIECNLEDTIKALKTRILEKVCSLEVDKILAIITRDEYMLLFNRKALIDGTLNESGIKDQDKIILCPKDDFMIAVVLVEVDVSLEPEMQCHSVLVRCSDTVATLKTKIKDIARVPTDRQILLRFKRKWLDDNENCLVEHGIVEFPLFADDPKYYLPKMSTFFVEALLFGAGGNEMQLV